MNWLAPLCLGVFGRPPLLVLTFFIISSRLFALTSKITDTPYFLQEGFGLTGQLLPGDGTMYCGPTSMSDNMVWLARNGFPQLAPALDQSNRTQAENANLVLSLAGLFGTSAASGTNGGNLVTGLTEYMRLKGFAATDFTCTIAGTGEPIPIPTLNYLLSANQGLSAVLVNVLWYNSNFVNVGGHYIALLAVNTGTSALTVSNPFPFTTPNPQVQPMSPITNAPSSSGLNGYLQFNDQISGSPDLAVLQYSIALQITNPSAATPAAPYDISNGGITIPTNGATLTVQAPITGTGGLTKTQAGTVSLANALTQNPTANAYRYSGGTSIAEGTVTSFEASGTPVGAGTIQLVGSTLSLQPVATNSPVSLSLATGLGATLNFGPGSVLELNRGTNTSLSVSIGGAANLPDLVPAANGSLLIKPTDGLSSLGVTTIVKVNGTGQNLPPVTYTIVSSRILAVDTTSAGQFLTYNPAANGFRVATYTSGSLVAAGANAVYAASAAQTLNANATVYALKVQNVLVQGLNGTQTLTVGQGGINQASGIILNGGAINNLKLAFGAAQAIIFASQTGGTVGAGISGTAGLVKVGPGNLTLSGRNSYSGSSVIASGRLTINSGSSTGIGNVSVYSGAFLSGNGAILGNLTLNSGATRNGAGTISGNVEVKAGATFSGGGMVYGSTVINGFLTPIGVANGTVFNGNITIGPNGILVWNLNKLVDGNTVGAVPGIDFSFFRVVGKFDLGVSGGLLLQFGPGLTPDKSLSFWTHPHTWTIATSDQPIGWTSAFGGLYEPLYKDGNFRWNNVKLSGGGYALQLYYSPSQ